MTPLVAPPLLDALPVQLRLVQRAASGTVVMGATFAAQPAHGMNGAHGFQSGTFEAALTEEGSATVTFPNGAGADGRLHRDRFECLTDARYEQGDEWIEVWHGVAGRGRLLFVGTPADWRVSRSTITLTLADATGPLELQREFAAGFWCHAPRDVFEQYTHGWVPIVADDFANGVDATQWMDDDTTTPTPGVVRLGPMPGGLLVLQLEASNAADRTVELDTERFWRLEVAYDRVLKGDASLSVAMVRTGAGGSYIALGVSATTVTMTMSNFVGTTDTQTVNAAQGASKTAANIALECHDRWVMFYVDGNLMGAMEYRMATVGEGYWVRIQLNNGTGAVAGSYVDLASVLLRRADRYLIHDASLNTTERGDLRLPGILPSGGLTGTYFDDAELRPFGTTQNYYRRVLSPTRTPYARRLDTTVDWSAPSAGTWQPPGPPAGEYFSARWTGAIYLDLEASDYFLKLSAVDDGARLWVGWTMIDRVACGVWGGGGVPPQSATSGGMRDHLGVTVQSGWYPLRLEYVSTSGSTGGLALQWSTSAGGTFTAVPATMLSPYGIYEADVRYDSHAEQLKAVTGTFGLQYRCEPRSLESGEFPGELVPRVRVGRDTDKVLAPSESTEVERSGSARETIQTLLADAAGIADPAAAAQLTTESVDYGEVRPTAVEDRHMMVMSGYESLADITNASLLRTRLASMLGLRLAPWEEIAARPRGSRELRDTFPLSGELALFAWEPGDGIRIVDAELGFADAVPRQIVAPSWPFVPDGLGAPSVRFRQRPRSQQDAFRELVRAALLPQRNYQGQLAIVTGTTVSVTASSGYTYCPMPSDRAVVSATLVVGSKTNATAWTVNILTGLTGVLTFYTSGRFDITPYVVARNDSYGTTGQEVGVQIVGGTGTVQAVLELLVRV